jgi:DNA-directed RNA polymerase I subunit RPA43
MASIAPQTDDYSLLHIERISQYVSLSPASLNSPLPAICASIFSPLLLSYFPPAKGIVLAYEDVELSSQAPSKSGSKPNTTSPEPLLLRHVDEYTAPFLWATASFLILRPEAGKHMTGRITHQSKTHITLSHLNTFPVSVTKDHLPDSWSWQQAQSGKVSKGWDGRLSDEGGCWVGGDGEKIEGELKVRIRDFDGRMDGRGKGKGFLKVEGSLLTVEEERERRDKGQKGKGRASGVLRAGQSEAIEVE